jgi:acetyl-CoA synthetase
MDEDGYLSYHSRKDDVIISSGRRIGPGEIEDSLEGHDAVLEAGVIGVPHDERGEVPKAFVTLADGVEPDDDLRTELQEFVQQRLARYEYPHEIAFVDDLPKTTTGKVRRTELRDRE